MSPEKIQELIVREHLSIFCASCQRYWEARSAGVPGHSCNSPGACCSPIGGGDFELYEGAISDRVRWCFVCGEPAAYGVRAKDKRACGICSKHLSFTYSLQQHEHLVLLGVNGKEMTPTEVFGPSSKRVALANVLRELEEDAAKGR